MCIAETVGAPGCSSCSGTESPVILAIRAAPLASRRRRRASAALIVELSDIASWQVRSGSGCAVFTLAKQ